MAVMKTRITDRLKLESYHLGRCICIIVGESAKDMTLAEAKKLRDALERHIKRIEK